MLFVLLDSFRGKSTVADSKPQNVNDICGRSVSGVKIILFSLPEGILYEVNGETS